MPATDVPDAVSAPGGVTYWKSTVNACWAFDDAVPACVPTLFDSGTTLMDVSDAVPDAPSTPGTVKAGSATLNFFSSEKTSSRLWSLTAGAEGEIAGIQVQDPLANRPTVIAGNPLFVQYDVHYDLSQGVIALYLNPVGSRNIG